MARSDEAVHVSQLLDGIVTSYEVNSHHAHILTATNDEHRRFRELPLDASPAMGQNITSAPIIARPGI